MTSLIVTNGDSAADLLRAAGRDETILPWRDVLHEGPIVGGTLEACSRRRVAYLAERFDMDAGELAQEFGERDAVLRRHAEFATIELWFEHDLYDQLQLVQVLAFLESAARTEGVLLVQADDFLGVQRADTILRFAEGARAVTARDLDLAAAVWSELGASTPELAAGRSERPAGSLPFLRPALGRFLEELPSTDNGLGRTEHAILAGIDGGTVNPVHLFHQVLEGEEAAFMGDTSFFRLIEDLALCAVPLIAGFPTGAPEALREAELALSDAGAGVLAGAEDHINLNGADRWWAGTRLHGRSVWRFDRDSRRPVAPGE